MIMLHVNQQSLIFFITNTLLHGAFNLGSIRVEPGLNVFTCA